jgi:uncharacterized SAM-binding protein YcdF (DUF218 family)
MVYFWIIALYAGFGSSFVFFWLIASVMFTAFGTLSFLTVKNILHLPALLVKSFACIFLVLLLLFLITEGFIFSGMIKNGRNGCKYIIVLGCQVRGTYVTNSLKKRLNTAYGYLCENPDTIAIVSGGQGRGEDASEAIIMKDYLIKKGIAGERILVEDRSENTAQNLKYSAALIEDSKACIGIVTSNFHVFRAVHIAKAAGLSNSVGIPAPSSEVLFLNYTVREAAGVIKDLLFGNLF